MTTRGSGELDSTLVTEVEAAVPSAQERLRHTFEAPPLTPAEQRLLEVLTYPEDLQSAWRERFGAVVQSELDACVTPQDQALLSKVATLMEWEWFAGPGESLPDGVAMNNHDDLVFLDDDVERYKYAVRDYLMYGRTSPDMRGPMIELATERHDYFWTNMAGSVREAIAGVVKETPAYAFLHALASEAPRDLDVPLSAAQRMIREAQEEDVVRRTYGLEDTDSLRMHYDAHSTLQRRLYQLDDERMRAPKRQEADPKKRLMNYIIHELNEFHGHKGDEQVVEIVQGEYDLAGLIRDGRREHIGDEMYETSDNWISANERNGPRTMAGYDWSWNLLYNLARELADPENKHLSALEVLDMSVLPVDDSYFYEAKTVAPGLKVYLHRDDIPIIKERYVPGKRWRPHTSEKDYADVIGADVLADDGREVIAHIAGSARRDVAGRVVTAARRVTHDKPRHINDYSFMLFVDSDEGNDWRLFGYSAIDSLECNDIDEIEPYIPGYQVAAHDPDEGVWYFKQAEEDPYKGSAEVSIGESGKDRLVAQLRSIGMGPMAEELSSYTDINLAQLVTMLQSHSDYTFDKKYRIPSYQSTSLTDEYFGQLVDEKGRLQVQCTGAATFLRHILQTALPGGQVMNVSGHMVNNKGNISDIGHMQVMVVHEGRQYFVDATPPSRWAGVVDPSSRAISNDNARADRKNPFAEAPKTFESQSSEAIEQATTSLESLHQERAQRTENIAERTKSLLKAHFDLLPNTPDDELYKHILRLKKDADPIRRVMEIVLKSENADERDIDSIQTAKSYIEAVKNADVYVLKRIGIPRYDGIFLTSLVAVLDDVLVKAS